MSHHLVSQKRQILPLSGSLSGEFDNHPERAIALDRYHQWLGYAFERFCRHNYRFVAKALEFSGIDFTVGSYFARGHDEIQRGYQIDLLFERKDKVLTICEIRYLQGSVGTDVIEEFENKLKLFPNKKQYSIQRVLITNTAPSKALVSRAYFDRVLTFDDLFDPRYWA